MREGATTRYLLNYYKPEEVHGINISAKQLKRCQVNAPGCTFLFMDAAELAFRDHSFDSIICVEAAFHFNTRQQFLREAHRVLKPGGRLILTDILRTRAVETTHLTSPAENYVRDLAEYRTLYFRVGFRDFEIIDATKECCLSFYRYLSGRARTSFYSKEIDWRTFERRMDCLSRRKQAVRYYLLASARKPLPERDDRLGNFP